MKLQEYAQYDGLGLAELVRKKKVTPRELAELALQAIDQLNPQLNAVIGRIVESGDQVDEAALPDGPFRGVPFLIKDLVLHAAGIPSDSGSRLFQEIAFPHDSELMARFKRAGLVTLGRTNTPELGLNITTEPLLHGPTRNPWNTSKSTGGSSGGSAAAVAARIVPWAHANDGGGSIRIPASACGVVGLKPSRGRVSLGPDFGEAILGMGIEFALTRTIRDCAALLDAVQGASAGDPYIIAPPERPYQDEIKRKPGNLKVAFMTHKLDHAPTDPECVRAVEETAGLLESLGHSVSEAAPQVDFEAVIGACITGWAGWVSGAAEMVRALLGRVPSAENLEATSWACYRHGVERVSGLDVLQTLAIFNQTNRALGGFMQQYDVLVTPTLPMPPFDLGVYNANDPSLDAAGWIGKLFREVAGTAALFNITGQPGISLPLHWTAGGLPVGVQFVGRLGDEATLLRLAAQLEEARPWIDRKPPISV